MPKTPSSDLFELIHSMSRTEKVYFKVFAGRKGTETPRYIKLFDIISRQGAPDEDKNAAAKMKLSPARFARLKNYLQELVMESLESFHANGSLVYKVRHMLLQASVLSEKGLVDQCEKHIRKARKIAEENYLSRELFSCISKERRLAIMVDNVEVIEKLFASELEAGEKLRSETHLNHLGYMVFLNVTMEEKDRDKEKLAAIMNDEILRSESSAPGIICKARFNYIHALYHMSNGNLPEGLHYFVREIELIEAEPNYIRANPKYYLGELYNLAFYYLRCGDFAGASETTRKMKSAGTRLGLKLQPDLLSLLFARTYTLEIIIVLNQSCELERLNDILKEMETGLKNIRISNYMVATELAFQITLAYFCLGDYKKALSWAEKSGKHRVTAHVKRETGQMKLITLLAHYELQHWNLLEELAASTKRFFIKHDLLSGRESAFLEFIGKKFPAIRSREEITRLKEKLDAIPEGEHYVGEKPVDLAAWVESKLLEVPFAEVLTRKIKDSAS